MVKGLAFVGYPVKDMARARKFYEEVFGLKVETQFGEAFIEYALADGVTFTLGKMDGWDPADNGSYAAFEVEDFDTMVEKLQAHDVQFHLEKQDFPNCNMAIIIDTEGNKLMVHKLKS